MKINLPEEFLNRPESLVLCFRIHSDLISFALFDPAKEGACFYQEIPRKEQPDILQNFKECFFENEFFTLQFRKILVLNCSSRFTFVPSILFEENNPETWMNFNISDTSGKLLAQKLNKPDLVVLHYLPEPVYEFIQRSFINPQFMHSISPLIAHMQTVDPTVNTWKMCIHIQPNGLDVVCFNQNEFILGNHFEAGHIQDYIYYVLYTWKQLKFDQLRDYAYLAGAEDLKQEITKKLKDYIRNISSLGISSQDHVYGIDTQAIPFDLASLSLCEL